MALSFSCALRFPNMVIFSSSSSHALLVTFLVNFSDFFLCNDSGLLNFSVLCSGSCLQVLSNTRTHILHICFPQIPNRSPEISHLNPDILFFQIFFGSQEVGIIMADTKEEDNASLWAKYLEVLHSNKQPTTTDKPQTRLSVAASAEERPETPKPTVTCETDPSKSERRLTVSDVNATNGGEGSSAQGDLASLDVHPDQLPHEPGPDFDSPTRDRSPQALPTSSSDTASLTCICDSRPEILPEAVNCDQFPDFPGNPSPLSQRFAILTGDRQDELRV